MKTIGTVAAAVLAFGFPAGAFAAGDEHFGNEPLGTANYAEWPGIDTLVNDPARVYHFWVNGNEAFHYRGDAAALNDFLKRFAAGGGVREVVLRPAPGSTKSFHGEEVAFDWKLQLVGGIAGHLATRDQGEKIWRTNPVVDVHVGDAIKLDELRLPPGVTVVGLKEVKGRVRDALDSEDMTVRGWGCGQLAELDRFDEENAAVIASMLKDPEEWVRLNAAGALASFGPVAKGTLPALREAREGAKEDLVKRIDETIREIEKGEPDSAAVEERQKRLREVEEFVAGRAAK